MKLKNYNISDFNFDSYKKVKDKYNRIDAKGVNQGRAVYFDSKNNRYIKIFHKDYCRRQNFIDALAARFFDELAPALIGLIYDDNEIVGYVSKAGRILSNSEYDFQLIPKEMVLKLEHEIKRTGMFFYDFVPINMVIVDGQVSLIDLESVYKLEDLYLLKQHNAKVKPKELYDFISQLWYEI